MINKKERQDQREEFWKGSKIGISCKIQIIRLISQTIFQFSVRNKLGHLGYGHLPVLRELKVKEIKKN